MKILALTPWPILNADSGGTIRCLNLLEQLGKVTVLTIDWAGNQSKIEKYKQLTQITLSIDTATKTYAEQLMEQYDLQSWDAIPWLINDRLDQHKNFIAKHKPDLIVLEHPWLVKLAENYRFIYDAHNCEHKNTQMLFGEKSHDFNFVSEIEKFTLENASHILYCSQDDLICMNKIYSVQDKSTMIPNGSKLHRKKNNKKSKRLLFIGTAYRPNIQAAQNLIDNAESLSDYEIVIVGGCGEYLKSESKNVKILGVVSDRRLFSEIKKSFALVNLSEIGSGTHLKIALVQSFGVPVITTKIGARGFKAPIVIDKDLHQALKELNLNYEQYSQSAYDEAKRNTWNSHGERIRKITAELLKQEIF